MSLDHNEVAAVKSSRNRTRTCPARGLQGQDNTKHSVSNLQLGKVKVKRAVWCSSAVVATTDSSWARYTLRCKTMHHLLEVRSRFFYVLPGIHWDFVRDPTMASGIFQDTSGFLRNNVRDIPQLPQMSLLDFHTSSCPCHNRCNYIQIGKSRYRWYLYEWWV